MHKLADAATTVHVHCSALAASQEPTGGGCSRGSRIAIHKPMMEQGRRRRPKASLERPRSHHDTRTQNHARQRASSVDLADQLEPHRAVVEPSSRINPRADGLRPIRSDSDLERLAKSEVNIQG